MRLGLPVGLSIFFEVSIFAVIALLIGSLGAQTVASHQIALNFTSLIFMVPLSFALAATMRVGHARGRADTASLSNAVQIALMISVVSVSLPRSHWWLLATESHIYTSNPEDCTRLLPALVCRLVSDFRCLAGVCQRLPARI